MKIQSRLAISRILASPQHGNWPDFRTANEAISRTTLAAAELTERSCYGLELDPKYADVVVERWQGLTGKKAQLEAMGGPLTRSGASG